MIGKKVKNSSKGSTKASRIGKLTEYVREPERDNMHEKCVYAGSVNFLSDDAAGQAVEMIALAQEAIRSRDPVNHYVLSWQEGERPTPAQCDEAVSIVLGEMGLTGHQAIYGLHTDTDNQHLHIVVNRVHPDTLNVVKINKGFDVEVLHRALARIEHAQGWTRERRGRYQVRENGELVRAEHGLEIEFIGEHERARQPDTRARDMEQRTGEKSAQRVGMEHVPQIVKDAQGWADLHQRLALAGMRYEKKGSGALLWVGAQPVKASTADRNASLGKLEKRFGAYEAAPAQQRVAERKPEALQADRMPAGWATDWAGYRQARSEYLMGKDAAWRGLRTQIDTERRGLVARHRDERGEVLSGRWTHKGEALSALRSVLAAQQAGERAAMQARHRTEGERLRERYGLGGRPAAFPDFEQWLRERGRAELADQWRHRHGARRLWLSGPAQEVEPEVRARDIRDFVGQVRGAEVHYVWRGETGEAREAGRPEAAAFVDRGRTIELHEGDRGSVLAALQLAQAKWPGGFEVHGDAAYRDQCVRLAAEHGFRVSNAELAPALGAARDTLKREREVVAGRAGQEHEARQWERGRDDDGPELGIGR